MLIINDKKIIFGGVKIGPIFSLGIYLLFLILIPSRPQVRLHLPHAPQSLILQSTGNLEVCLWKSMFYPRGKSISLMGQAPGTWAWLDKLADHCLLQSWTGCSSMLCFSDDLPASRLGSSKAATQTAFSPCVPIANFAVN